MVNSCIGENDDGVVAEGDCKDVTILVNHAIVTRRSVSRYLVSS